MASVIKIPKDFRQNLGHSIATVICTFFAYCIPCYSQGLTTQQPRDKFERDTAAINRLCDLADEQADFDRAILLYRQMEQMGINAKYPDGVAMALLAISGKFIDHGNYDSAFNYLAKALPFCQQSVYRKGVLAGYYTQVAMVNSYQGLYVVATTNYHQALRELEKVNRLHTSQAATIYNNLATIQMALQQYNQALVYIGKAEKIAYEGHFENKLSVALSNKGICYTNIGTNDSAKKCYSDVLVLAKKLKNQQLLAATLINLGGLFEIKSEYRKSLVYYREAISISEQFGIPYTKIIGSYSLGKAYYNLKKYSEAEAILIEGLDQAQKLKMREDIQNGYSTLSQVYKATNQYAKASTIQDTLLKLKDSLFSTEKTKAINTLEIKYRTAEKDKQIAKNQLLLAKQERDLAKKEKDLAKKNLWIGGISGGAVILTLALVALYRAKQHERSLALSHLKWLEQEQEIGVLRAMRTGEELERGHIARELHDGIGGILAAAMLRFSAIKQQHEELGDTKEYHEVMGLLDEMGNEIRKTSHHLMPEVLLKNSLPGAVQSFCDHVGKGGNIELDVQCYGDFGDLSQEFKLGLYRMIQELVQNIIRHAGAKYALVQLTKDDKILSLTVEDNGKGFDTGDIKGGIGLHNLQARVQSLNGHFTLESEVGRGTNVYIEFRR